MLRLRFKIRTLFLLVALVAIASTCLRHIQNRQRRVLDSIVQAGGKVESRSWYVPIPGAPVEAIVIPGASAKQISFEDLRLFPFLDKVVIEDLSMSGESDGKPWSFTGSIESDGPPPSLEVLAEGIVSAFPTNTQPFARDNLNLQGESDFEPSSVD